MNFGQQTRRLRFLPILAAVFLLSATTFVACGDDDFKEGGGANLEVSPSSLSFSETPAGSQSERRLTVTNTGDRTLNLPFSGYELVPAGSPFIVGYMSVEGVEVETLDPGESATVNVLFSPTDGRAYNASLWLRSTNGGEVEVPITTVAPAPRLQADPSPVIFNGVGPGQTADIVTTVSNVGSAELVIAQGIFVPGNNIDFEVVSGLPEPDTALAPGEGFEITIRYTPTGDFDEIDRSQLEFTSNSLNEEGHIDIVEITAGVEGPRIEIEPVLVDFGALQFGDRQSQDVLVRNIGIGILEVTDIYLDVDTSTDFTYEGPATLTLAEDETATVTVSYEPTNPGLDAGYLVFESNDAVTPGVVANLRGAWAGPDLVVKPTTLDFGAVAIGVSKTLSFDMFNEGLLDLTITNMAEMGFPVAPQLSYVIEGGATAPFVIEGNGKRRVTVTFAPTVELPRATSTLEVQSTDPDTPNEPVELIYEGVANGQCTVALVPTTLNFGLVVGGRNKQLPIMVRNSGAAPCRIQAVTLQADFLNLFYGNPFSLRVPFSPIDVPPGDQRLIEFDYSPFSGDTDSFAAQAIFSVSDLLNNQFNLTCPSASFSFPPTGSGCSFGFGAPGNCWACLTGSTGDPALAAVPGDLDFGLVTLGCSSQNTRMRIYNKGTAPTNIVSVTIDPACGANFSLAGVPPVPFMMSPGTFEEIELVYTPVNTNQDSCRLIVEGDTETLTIPISGQGTTDENQTDVFDQVSGRKVDVLFVIDNSGSMGDDQTNLANNFSAFIAAANTWGVDFQIGVTTTDSADEGKLQSRNGHPRIIASTAMSAAQVQSAFQDNIRVGDTGSATERGLQAADRALTDPNITEDVPGNCPNSASMNACAAPYSCDTYDQTCGGHNARFLRDDASLEVIFVSDESDQSQAVVDFYVDLFKNIKGFQNDSLFHAHAIIGSDTSGGCDTSGFQRYKDVATRTNGQVEGLCSNFSTGLANIGNNAFGLRVQFFLSRVPVVATIQVTVNGNNQLTGWTYDPVSNTIVFDPSNVPPQNARIEISYKARCF